MTAPPTAGPRVRFDTAGAPAFAIRGHREVLVANAPSEIAPLLGRVEDEAAAGRHAAGFVSYEAAAACDRALRTHPPLPGLPLAWFVVGEERAEVGPPRDGGGYEMGAWEPALEEAEHARRVARVRELIAAGDTYQVNLTFPLRAPFRGDPLALYADLLGRQHAGYAAFLDLGRFAILSLSPELFFERAGERVTTRPMKGTRPRGRWPAEDEALAGELAGSEKDRAENLMIVDLLRNDLGRIARPGTVRVPERFAIERYPTVHQMTSTVAAEVPPGTRLARLFGALFPCGSVTGAPKVRTMEIIREMEDGPRGVYCGAVGVVGADRAIFNVPIRTLVIDREREEARLDVGSGITIGSDPAAEYRECLDKAAFTRASAHVPLLETMRWEPGRGVRLLDRHLARLEWSAGLLGIPFDRDAILSALQQATGDVGDAGDAGDAGVRRLRLLLARDGAPRVEAGDLPASPEPVRLAVDDDPVDPADPGLYLKTADRRRYDRRRARRPDADDVLLVNQRGEVTESTIANLVVQIDGRCWTPPLASGLLPGVMRAELLDRGSVAERVLTVADLGRADRIWLVSSLRGRRRAVLIDR
jgi:para-aminobenzoate synthetase / 4-amino-4-deoxychorismate lyase